jgi:L-ribulose-5-phosphate 3-epimerase UlaE
MDKNLRECLMKELGIMQGRLSTRYMGRYQAFPKHAWQSEFYIAQDLGFQRMEFILDFNDAEENPLMSENGIEEIKKLEALTSVKVKSICADYFMEAPLFNKKFQSQSCNVLEKLIKNASHLGVKDIVIPCVDQSTLASETDRSELISVLNSFTNQAKSSGVLLNLETDLNPGDFKSLLSKLDTNVVKVNYDIGNSASLGFDPEEEFSAYGEFISDLHIKDRVLGGASVPLGTGNANFEKVFELLKEFKFDGNIVMQAARAEGIAKDLSLLEEQVVFARNYISKYLES